MVNFWYFAHGSGYHIYWNRRPYLFGPWKGFLMAAWKLGKNDTARNVMFWTTVLKCIYRWQDICALWDNCDIPEAQDHLAFPSWVGLPGRILADTWVKFQGYQDRRFDFDVDQLRRGKGVFPENCGTKGKRKFTWGVIRGCSGVLSQILCTFGWRNGSTVSWTYQSRISWSLTR